MRQGELHGLPFHALRRMTQGGLTSPTLFNVAVDNLIRHCLYLTINNPAVTHDGVGDAVGQKLEVFYYDGGMISSHDPEWLQGYNNVFIGLFRRINFEANIVDSKTMACHLGDIYFGISEEGFTRRSTGEGANYRNSLRQWIPFPECGVEVTAGSLIAHSRRLHG